MRGIPRRKLIFGHKPNAPRPARTGGPFHFFGIFVIFLKKKSARSGIAPAVMAGKVQPGGLFAISGAENPFNRLKASPNLHRPKNDDPQMCKIRRRDHMSRPDPCKNA
ncbi:hypothetical protein [Agrobacterium tumefaciens]|uniref:hypothetical protein n=1 Tax=Agrobacterium tumefaciens TaxID=358 RepID=UPI0021D2C4A3|nr:hypothetical protein [Agrobacterium tumefaciens]UXT96331.1 hypothetical protein FY129_02230 [Agrobacterium tumefaciens]